MSNDKENLIDSGIFAEVAEIAKEENKKSSINKVNSDTEEIDTLYNAINDALQNALVLSPNGLSRKQRLETIVKSGSAWLLEHGRFYCEAGGLSGRTKTTVYYFNSDMKKLVPLSSDYFASWLAESSNISRTTPDFQQLFSKCEDLAIASSKSHEFEPATYFARRGDAIYISSGESEMVRIHDGKCEVVDNGTDDVLFLSSAVLKPWRLIEDVQKTISPIDCLLYKTMPVREEYCRTIFLLWLLSIPACLKKFPLFLFEGGYRSGKTKAASGIFDLLGMEPRYIQIDDSEKGLNLFWVALNRGGLMILDNQDRPCKWLPDALSGASTGASAEVRKLYTADQSITLKARASIVITSLNPTFASDSGAADRLITCHLKQLTGKTSDKELSDDIEIHRDEMMSYIAWTVCHVLLDEIKTPVICDSNGEEISFNKRHPAWGKWCYRCGKVIGIEQETIKALAAAEEDKSLMRVINDGVFGRALYEYMRETKEPFEGFAQTLSDKLNNFIGDSSETKFAITAHSVGKRLEKAWGSYQAVFKAEKKVGSKTKYKFFPPEVDDDESVDQLTVQ